MEFFRSKRVLVTGGGGFIGSHFAEFLVTCGASVRIPMHRTLPRIRGERIELVNADLLQPEDALRAVDSTEIVVHAAGAVGAAGVTPLQAMSLITANLFLLARVLEASWHAGVERVLIFSSSTGYPTVDHPVTEEEFWEGPPHASYHGYGWMRRYCERLAEFVARNSTLRIAIVRPSAVYGRYDNFSPGSGHVIPSLIRKAVEFPGPLEVWGNGDEVRDFLHVNDFVRGSLMTLEKHACCDPVNIGYGSGISILALSRKILQAAGREGTEIVCTNTRATTIPVRLVDISKARSALDFQPEVSLEQGLKDTVDWFREYFANKVT